MESKFLEAVDYNPESGEFKWKTTTRNRARVAGNNPSSYSSNGYLEICVGGTKVSAHKLAWHIYYGYWPNHHIDHIDGDKRNNRISNLRKSDPSINMKNRGFNKNNTTGKMGVYKSGQKWRSRIRVSGKLVNLGTYENYNDAVEARESAEVKYKFHINHGKRSSWCEDQT